jgi:hypothetical protein
MYRLLLLALSLAVTGAFVSFKTLESHGLFSAPDSDSNLPAKYATVFDFDDTLFPTTHVRELIKPYNLEGDPDEIVKTLRGKGLDLNELDQHAVELVNLAKQIGRSSLISIDCMILNSWIAIRACAIYVWFHATYKYYVYT